MAGRPAEGGALQSPPRQVRLVWILVAITAVLSLLYGIQYYLGSPLRLPVVSEIEALSLDPGRSLVAVGDRNGQVHIWKAEQLPTRVTREFDVAQEAPWLRRTLSGHSESIIEVAFLGDGSTLLTLSDDGQVLLWDITTYGVRQEYRLDGAPLVDAHVNSEGTTLATLGEDGTVHIWDVETGRKLQAVGPGTGSSKAVTLSADGSQVAAGDGANIQVWDTETGESVQTLAGYWEDEEAQETWLGHEEDVTAIAFSPDGLLLASGSDDTTIMFWDLETGEVAWASEGHWAPVTAMVFNEEGDALLSGGADYKIRDFRVPGGRVTASYEGHLATVNDVAYGLVPDTIATVGDDGTMRVWESANQYVVHMEWSRYGLQPSWGRLLGIWMLISGIIGLVCLWGLISARLWSHLVALVLYLLGPIVVLGLPLLEVITYPLPWSQKLGIGWPLLVLVAWYIILLVALTREIVGVYYEAPRDAPLSEQLVVSQQTVKTRFGIYTIAVWIGLMVILYSVLRQFNLDVAFMGHYFGFIMGGAGLTVLVSAASIIGAMVLALLGALGRLSRNPIANGFSGFYISLIRGTPLLVQIFIWYLGLPRLGIILSPIVAGILALSVNYGAYMTEIFRAGIQAISKGQHEAAAALGMSGGQTFRRVVLPQAFRIVIPPIGNEFIAMMKDSSLVSVMSVWELTYRAQKIGRQNFRNLETFLIAAAFYWILTVIFQFLQGKLEDYMARGERR